MAELEKKTAVVKKIETGTSSSGNSYARVVLHDGGQIDFYHDGFQEELLEFEEEYVGLICDVFFEDRGYTVGKAIVPHSPEKAGELLDRKKSESFEEPSDKWKRGLHQWVDLFYEA